MAWSRQIQRDEEREKRREKKGRKREALKRGRDEGQGKGVGKMGVGVIGEGGDAGNDWEELANEERLAKKLKKGLIDKKTFEKSIGFDELAD